MSIFGFIVPKVSGITYSRKRTSESLNRFSETNCSNEPTHRIDSDIPTLAAMRAGKWRFLPKSFPIRIRRNTELRAIGVAWCQSTAALPPSLLILFSAALGDHIGRQGKKCQRDEGIVGHVNTKCKMFTSSSTHWRAFRLSQLWSQSYPVRVFYPPPSLTLASGKCTRLFLIAFFSRTKEDTRKNNKRALQKDRWVYLSVCCECASIISCYGECSLSFN